MFTEQSEDKAGSRLCHVNKRSENSLILLGQTPVLQRSRWNSYSYSVQVSAGQANVHLSNPNIELTNNYQSRTALKLERISFPIAQQHKAAVYMELHGSRQPTS